MMFANENLPDLMPGCYGWLPGHCYVISSVQGGCLLAQVKQALWYSGRSFSVEPYEICLNFPKFSFSIYIFLESILMVK